MRFAILYLKQIYKKYFMKKIFYKKYCHLIPSFTIIFKPINNSLATIFLFISYLLKFFIYFSNYEKNKII